MCAAGSAIVHVQFCSAELVHCACAVNVPVCAFAMCREVSSLRMCSRGSTMVHLQGRFSHGACAIEVIRAHSFMPLNGLMRL
jgi:hypothetical protein